MYGPREGVHLPKQIRRQDGGGHGSRLLSQACGTTPVTTAFIGNQQIMHIIGVFFKLSVCPVFVIVAIRVHLSERPFRTDPQPCLKHT